MSAQTTACGLLPEAGAGTVVGFSMLLFVGVTNLAVAPVRLQVL